MKYLFLSVFIFGFSISPKIVNILQDEDKILWSSKTKLKWIDFKGNPDLDRGFSVAATQCEIKVLKIEVENELPQVKIGTFFIKSRSWTVTEDLLTLKHEQLHFDIYELYVRKIRCEFKNLNNQKIKDINPYQECLDYLILEAEKRNSIYDNEVYFNDVRQQEWFTEVAKELEELKEYEYIPEEE